MHQVCVTDRRGGEHLERYQWQPARSSWRTGAMAIAAVWPRRRAPAGGCGRADPSSDLPPGNRGGPALQCAALAAATGRCPSGSGAAGVAGQGSAIRVRLVAAKLDAYGDPARPAPAAPQSPKGRAHPHHAHAELWRAGCLLITTLDAGTWSAADVLYVYRARWQVELVFKKMKQLLRLNQIRSKHRTSVEATVRALLIAWALHEDTTTLLRTLLSATATPDDGGEQLAGERAGARHAAAAGAGQVVGGPSPGVPPPFAPLSV